MTINEILFALEIFLHDLFTVVWVGGLITLGITVLPAAKKTFGEGPEVKKLLAAIQKRLSILVYISMGGLIVTGLKQAKHAEEFQGLFVFSSPFSTILAIKHVFVLIMIAVSLYRSLVLGRQEGEPSRSREKLSLRLLFLNMILGIAVLLLSGFSTVL